ncbi:disease resistance protein Roq1-like [Lactuca sativa]|nr:disease resistance protein Roq1-like [Lactuca sativa]
MIGIWGVGGGGKTTLASSVYDIISSKFDDFCFVENLRKESSKYCLVNLQEKVLSSVLKEKQVCVILGRSCYRYRTVLIVLDDANHLDQLNVFAGSQDWFGEGSRIITSRDEHSFIEHRVDVIHKIVLIDNDEVIQLFRMHGLKPIEKRLLVRDERAMVLVAVWIFHRVRSINMWTQKALIIIWDGKFDMHDLTNFMGRYTDRGMLVQEK